MRQLNFIWLEIDNFILNSCALISSALDVTTLNSSDELLINYFSFLDSANFWKSVTFVHFPLVA